MRYGFILKKTHNYMKLDIFLHFTAKNEKKAPLEQFFLTKLRDFF